MPGSNLVEAIAECARGAPGRGIGFLDGHGRVGERRTYPELLGRWRVAAGRLSRLGAGPGELVLVSLASSWDFLDAWFGAVLTGAVPVAVAPPGGLGTSSGWLGSVGELRERFGPRVIVATAGAREQAASSGLSELVKAVTTPDELRAIDSSPLDSSPSVDPEAPAFLQLTSGSTGVPRGVEISHRALLATTRAVEAMSVAAGDEKTTVCWLPMHHDMGLVGCLLFSVVGGHDLWLLSHRAFLGRPQAWLRAAGSFPGVCSPAPNFAYQACVERAAPDHLADVDLGGWRVAIAGAEMIRPATLSGFAERFGPLGFGVDAFHAAYGMAESTLAVTADVRRQGVRTRAVPDGAEGFLQGGEVCSVGGPVEGMEVRVCAPDGTEVPGGEVGEIQARGACLFNGYHRDPAGTAEVMRDGWLRTGDLGFLADGELWVTGRSKDLIIVNGHNLMPHQLEWIAEAVTGGGGTRRAGAFAVDDGRATEQAVLVVETDSGGDLAALGRDLRRRVARELGLPLSDVAFVRRGVLPKTTSGKVRRAELRRRYVARELERLDEAR